MKTLTYTTDEGMLVDANGCYHDSLDDFLQHYVLGFCGCGRQDANLAYVRAGLDWIRRRFDATDYKTHHAEGLALFGSEASMYFFLYWANDRLEGELAEHGGSVGGCWLTDYGREVLALLNTWAETAEGEAA